MINKLQAESSARIQVAPGTANLLTSYSVLICVGYLCVCVCVCVCADGSEINGERGVTICGTPDTVE